MSPEVRPNGSTPATPAPEPERPETGTEAPSDGYPAAGSGTVVLQWVGEDRARAQVALGRETRRPAPRSTVVEPLERLLARGALR